MVDVSCGALIVTNYQQEATVDGRVFLRDSQLSSGAIRDRGGHGFDTSPKTAVQALQ